MDVVLTVEATVKQVIQTEIKELVYYKGAPYIKFLLMSSAIEFLGACMDTHEFEDEKQSHDRFNTALTKLFPKKYHKYAKKSSKINLFKDLRCGMIHKLSPTKLVRFTERRHLKNEEKLHLVETNGYLLLVLEDLYDDIYDACEKLKKLDKQNKLPSKKLSTNYIRVTDAESGNSNLTKVVNK